MTHSIELLQRAGWVVHALDRDATAPGLALADAAAVVDPADAGAVTAYAGAVRADVILALNDAGVPSAAIAGRRLGVGGIDQEAALRCVDKGLMRDAWDAAGLPQPRYRVAGVEKVAAAAQELGFPLVLKPTTGSGSRGVSLVRSEEDLRPAMELAEAGARANRFIVEEWLAGTEMTVEGLVQQGRPYVLAKSDKVAQVHPRFRVAMALNYPASFPEEVLRKTDELAGRAALALGIRDGAFHLECMVDGTDVSLVEMAGRPGGGAIFSRIVEAVSGVCMPQALVSILAGEPVEVPADPPLGACYKFFSPPSGIYRSVRGLDEARRMPGVLDIDFNLAPGTVVGAIATDMGRPGALVTRGADRAEAIDNAERAVASLRFHVDPCPA